MRVHTTKVFRKGLLGVTKRNGEESVASFSGCMGPGVGKWSLVTSPFPIWGVPSILGHLPKLHCLELSSLPYI